MSPSSMSPALWSGGIEPGQTGGIEGALQPHLAVDVPLVDVPLVDVPRSLVWRIEPEEIEPEAYTICYGSDTL